MRNWRKASGEDSRNGLDATKFACMVIGHTTVGIEIDGEEVFDENGNEITFASPLLLEMTETSRPLPDCVELSLVWTHTLRLLHWQFLMHLATRIRLMPWTPRRGLRRTSRFAGN